jgi:transketolase
MTQSSAEGMGGFKDTRHVSPATLDARSYGRALLAAARADARIVCLGADLSQPTQTDLFRDQIPERFFMMGIQEAHMVGAAGGMARVGDIPFCHSFCVFITRRVYDQIAMQAAYPNLPIKLVGFLPGLATELGPSHQAIDDVALMRALPNMVVLEPQGPEQVGAAVAAALSYPGPVYLRLMVDRSKTPSDTPLVPLSIGKGLILRQGRDIALIAAGIMVKEAMRAAELLAEQGVGASVINMASLKPIDSELVRETARTHRAVLTIENHSKIGGLGSAVAEVLAESAIAVKFGMAAVRDVFSEGASLNYLLQKHGLNAPAVCSTALKLLK